MTTDSILYTRKALYKTDSIYTRKPLYKTDSIYNQEATI